MRLRTQLIISITFACTGILSQTGSLDSLESVLTSYKTADTTRVNLLTNIAFRYYAQDPVRTLRYAREAERLSNNLNFTEGQIKSLRLIGIYFDVTGSYDSAVTYLGRALEKAQKAGISLAERRILSSLAVVHINNGNYPKAMEFAQQELLNDIAAKDTYSMVICLNDIGEIYRLRGEYPQAADYYLKAYNLARLNPQSSLTELYICSNLGDVYIKQNKFAEAHKFLDLVIQNASVANDKTILAAASEKTGMIYQKTGQPDSALIAFRKALKLFEEISSKQNTATSLLNISSILVEKGQYEKALEFSLKSLKLSQEGKFIQEQAEGHLQISEIFNKLRNYQKAYKHFKLYKELNDSIFNLDNLKKITQMEYEYRYKQERQEARLEQQKKDALIASEQKQQRIIQFSLLAGFILMMGLAIFLYQSFLAKKRTNSILLLQKKEIELQRNNLEELNATKDKLFSVLAHDLRSPFNTLIGFSDWLLKKADTMPVEKLIKYLEHIRQIANNTFQLLVNLLDWSRSQRGIIEIIPESLDLPAALEKEIMLLRSQASAKKIELITSIDGKQVPVISDINLIGTVLRNLISNAIKFSSSDSLIELNIRFSDEQVTFSVRDYGVGMPQDVVEKLFRINGSISTKGTAGEKGTGLGLLVCADFAERLKGSIRTESEPGKGSTFYFSIPIQAEGFHINKPST